MCPLWVLVAATLVGVVRGAVSQCWEHPSCQQVDSESSMLECIQLCRSLPNEMPLIPGEAHLQPPPLSGLLPDLTIASYSSPSPQAKRSYSMEHFRWGKPVGKKRRPIKIYTSNDVEEESAEVFPGEMRRRELLGIIGEMEDKPKEAEEESAPIPTDFQEKKDATYKMKHFRWSGPPASKRYGGFMKSWDERSQRPLLTLFKNVINKDGQEEKREQ
ncbi:pro-opiomelanocortin-like [Gouania willdenowi]|uniref:Pro-opiomelanocortin-like n=1 Tax=Gouania willdenowi TaxID=441366 RepID=A0A8C5ERH1_GOUWI|nr:pro-opiomelanocortin-like [Gouania willdenowi]XP_028316561.1 pro-opiomelanocortin-like [Gouania willdenowi]